MTCIAAFLDSTGCAFVADKRLMVDCTVLTDDFSKVFSIADGSLTIALAGDVGSAQIWLRAAEKRKCKTLTKLLDEQVGGEYSALIYDAREHKLHSADGHGAVSQCKQDTLVAIGSGYDFVKGFVHAHGGLPASESSEAKMHVLYCAIDACAEDNTSVSKNPEMFYVKRAKPAKASKARKARR